MKRFIKYLFITTVLIIIAIIILAFLAQLNQQRAKQRNKPVWNSDQAETNAVNITINKNIVFNLSEKDDGLILKPINLSETFTLFSNFKNKFESVKVFVKDINQDGIKEIIAQASHEFSSDLYVFYYLGKPVFGKHIITKALWAGDQVRFKDDESLFLRSCGSRYCNDTYYLWNENKLISQGTDTYESW